MYLAGISVRDEDVLELAQRLRRAGLAETAVRLEDARAADERVLGLTILDRDAILLVLDDPPIGLALLRGVLASEHEWRLRHFAAPSTAVTVDAVDIVRFVIEVDALATFDAIVRGDEGSWLQQHIGRIVDDFERALLGDLHDDDAGEIRARGVGRGHELADDFRRMRASDHPSE